MEEKKTVTTKTKEFFNTHPELERVGKDVLLISAGIGIGYIFGFKAGLKCMPKVTLMKF